MTEELKAALKVITDHLTQQPVGFVETMNVSVPLAELPEDVRQRLSREALRRGVHVKQVLKEWILEMARRMVDSATPTSPAPVAVNSAPTEGRAA